MIRGLLLSRLRSDTLSDAFDFDGGFFLPLLARDHIRSGGVGLSPARYLSRAAQGREFGPTS